MERSLLQRLLIASRSKRRQLGERQNFTSSHYVGIFSPGYRKLFKVIIVFKTANLQDGTEVLYQSMSQTEANHLRYSLQLCLVTYMAETTDQVHTLVTI